MIQAPPSPRPAGQEHELAVRMKSMRFLLCAVLAAMLLCLLLSLSFSQTGDHNVSAAASCLAFTNRTGLGKTAIVLIRNPGSASLQFPGSYIFLCRTGILGGSGLAAGAFSLDRGESHALQIPVPNRTDRLWVGFHCLARQSFVKSLTRRFSETLRLTVSPEQTELVTTELSTRLEGTDFPFAPTDVP
jgi:hypothetical protein